MSEPWPRIASRSRALQIGSWVVITIFLGAIGSGLWDTMLRPAAAWVSQGALSFTSFLFHGYVDRLYSRVSRNPADQLALLPFAALVLFVILGPWLALWRLSALGRDLQSARERTEDRESQADETLAVKKFRRLALRVGVSMALVSSLLYAELFFRTMHTRNAALFVERSIDILGPQVDNQTYLTLRGHFRGIESAADFYKLEAQLQQLAQQHSIRLPEFSPIR